MRAVNVLITFIVSAKVLTKQSTQGLRLLGPPAAGAGAVLESQNPGVHCWLPHISSSPPPNTCPLASVCLFLFEGRQEQKMMAFLGGN